MMNFFRIITISVLIITCFITDGCSESEKFSNKVDNNNTITHSSTLSSTTIPQPINTHEADVQILDNTSSGDKDFYIKTEKPGFIIGEDIVVDVLIRNDKDVEINDNLKIKLDRIFGNDDQTISEKVYSINIPPRKTIKKTLHFPKNIYLSACKYWITALSMGKHDSVDFEVLPGYEVTTMLDKQEAIMGELGKLTVNVKNVLDVIIPEIKVSLYVDPSSGGDRHINYVINNLEPNQTYTKTIDIKITKPIIPCYVTSDIAGNKYISAEVKVHDPLGTLIE